MILDGLYTLGCSRSRRFLSPPTREPVHPPGTRDPLYLAGTDIEVAVRRRDADRLHRGGVGLDWDRLTRVE
jgi:hypothetical protein